MSYPSIKNDNFGKLINKKFKRYKIPRRKKPFKEICFPKKFEFQLPQKFVSSYINPKTPYKGLLVFHRIGAGKTCAAVRIGEEWKKYRKIVVVVPASLKGNFRNELRSQCAGSEYITSVERRSLENLHPSSQQYKDIINVSDKRIDKHYSIYSYNKFVDLAEEGRLSLHNSVLIIDEVQNMISEEGKFYEVLYDTIHSAPDSLRIVLLSATPMFDKPTEIALTMNLLRIPFELPTGREFEKMFVKTKKGRNGWYYYTAENLNIFKERIKGYVSYFAGAPAYVFPEKEVRYVECRMSNFQYKSYLTVLNSENKDDKLRKIKEKHRRYTANDGDGIAELPNNFFIGTRLISNVVFPNRCINEDGFKSFVKGSLSYDKLAIYSPKFYKIMRKISRCIGTVFVYSNFKEYGGIKSFIRVLESQGYKNYIKDGEGWKRYAVWTGDEKDYIKEEIKAVFNHRDNHNGSKIKVMLGSPSIKEGVSLLRVQQVHIMEPYWNQSRLDQVIGRAIRYCSHKDMADEKRLVKVYIYIAVHEKIDETIDQYIHKLASRKNKLIKEFELAVKEVAVDCSLNIIQNNYNEPEPLKCDTKE